MVTLLVDKYGCATSIKNRSQDSLLHLACEAGNASLVRTLILKYRGDVNARNDMKLTPTLAAATCGKEEVVLTEFGCEATAKTVSNKSLLHLSCHQGNIDLVWTLMTEYKADVTSRDYDSLRVTHHFTQVGLCCTVHARDMMLILFEF